MQRSKMESFQDVPLSATKPDTAQLTEAIFGPLSLSPGQIDAPAFFVDNNLSIRWIATGGTDSFSAALAQELRATASRNVFNLLLRPAIKHAVADWRSFFSFVYTHLRRTSTRAWEVVPGFPIANRMHASSTDNSKSASKKCHAFMIDSCPIGTDNPRHRLFGMTFDKGTLFTLRPDRGAEKTVSPVQDAPVTPHTRSADVKKTICVLMARLNQPHGLAGSMLPDFFLTMMNRMWDEADGIVRALGGKRAACNGPRLCYVFSENAGRDPIFSAICCALRLNNQMVLLEEKLRAQYGWSNEIRLNMGIGHGTDIQRTSDTTSSLAFVIPGGAFEQAALLSRIAGKGEIWITRQAANRLPENLIDQVVLGAYHQGEFLRHFFTQISDIHRIKPHIQIDPDMEDWPVAQIKELER